MTSLLIENLAGGETGTGHLLAFTPRPRLLETELVPQAQETFLVGRERRPATRYLVRLELGGLTGVVASALGKAPPDLAYWISAGPARAFVKFEGSFYIDGPIWRIEVSAPRWPK